MIINLIGIILFQITIMLFVGILSLSYKYTMEWFFPEKSEDTERNGINEKMGDDETILFIQIQRKNPMKIIRLESLVIMFLIFFPMTCWWFFGLPGYNPILMGFIISFSVLVSFTLIFFLVKHYYKRIRPLIHLGASKFKDYAQVIAFTNKRIIIKNIWLLNKFLSMDFSKEYFQFENDMLFIDNKIFKEINFYSLRRVKLKFGLNLNFRFRLLDDKKMQTLKNSLNQN